MNILTLLNRNLKWRLHNAFTIVITILQPMLWLVLFGTVAAQTMPPTGGLSYTAFILPGLVVLVCFGTCSSGGIMNFMMKDDGSFYRLLIAPVSRSAILLGQILEAICCTFFEITVICIISLFLGVSFSFGSLEGVLIFTLIFMTAFFIAAVAYAISLSLPNIAVYETVMNALVLPIFFLSTALFPTAPSASVLNTIIAMNPFTHAIDALRALAFHGEIEMSQIAFVLLLLGMLDFLSFFWALHRLRAETNA